MSLLRLVGCCVMWYVCILLTIHLQYAWVRCGQRSIIIQNNVGFFSGNGFYFGLSLIIHKSSLLCKYTFHTLDGVRIPFREFLLYAWYFCIFPDSNMQNAKKNQVKWEKSRDKEGSDPSKNAKVFLNFQMGVGLALSIESDRAFMILHTK